MDKHITIKFLGIHLNNDIYAIPVSDICEINRIANLYIEKSFDNTVIGMINYHGITTPVFNLKKILCMKKYNEDTLTMWFAFKHLSGVSCFAFDSLYRMLHASSKDIDNVSKFATMSIHEQYIQNYLRINEQLIPVLTLENWMQENI
jgi:chemotaxis signal transduction protein